MLEWLRCAAVLFVAVCRRVNTEQRRSCETGPPFPQHCSQPFNRHVDQTLLRTRQHQLATLGSLQRGLHW